MARAHENAFTEWPDANPPRHQWEVATLVDRCLVTMDDIGTEVELLVISGLVPPELDRSRHTWSEASNATQKNQHWVRTDLWRTRYVRTDTAGKGMMWGRPPNILHRRRNVSYCLKNSKHMIINMTE